MFRYRNLSALFNYRFPQELLQKTGLEPDPPPPPLKSPDAPYRIYLRVRSVGKLLGFTVCDASAAVCV